MKPIIVLPGILVRDRLGAILDASSTVTLIKTKDSGNILVDTGERSRRDSLLAGLKKEGMIGPAEVAKVVFTHGHGDHMGNNDLFLNAEFYSHPDEYIMRSNKAGRYHEISEGFELAQRPRVYAIETPGHTGGCMTIIVESDSVYAITGDALPIQDNYRQWVPPGINIDPDLAIKSMERIVNMADYVIPGHDIMFKIDHGL